MARRNNEPGVPLGHYREDRADVRLYCDACTYTVVVPLEVIIARLDARGLVGEKVGVIEAARHSRRACPECGARSWTSRPQFPRRPGQDGLPP